MTAFHVLYFVLFWLGVMAGVTLGGRLFGFPGSFGGAIALGYAAYALCRWIDERSCQSFIRTIQGMSTEQLRKFMTNSGEYGWLVTLAELINRGEDIQSERSRFILLLNADEQYLRERGWKFIQLFYPEAASQLAGYDPA